MRKMHLLTKCLSISLSVGLLACSAAALADDPSADLSNDPGFARENEARDDVVASGPDDLYTGSEPLLSEDSTSSSSDNAIEGVSSAPAFTFQGSGTTDSTSMQAICDYLTKTVNNGYEINSDVVATVPVVNVVSSHLSGSSRYIEGGFSVWNFSSDGNGRLLYFSGGTDTGLIVLRQNQDGSWSVDESASSLSGDSQTDASASSAPTSSATASDSAASDAASVSSAPDSTASGTAFMSSSPDSTASGTASASSVTSGAGTDSATSQSVPATTGTGVNDSTISSALSFNAYEDENQMANLIKVFTEDPDRTQYLTSAFIRMYLKENGLDYSSYSLTDKAIVYSLEEADRITPIPTPESGTASGASSASVSSSPAASASSSAESAVGDSISQTVLSDLPDMNIVGDWISSSGNARMQIAAENTDRPLMIIDMQNSSSQNTEWILHGTYLDGVVSYTFGSKITQTFDENGSETDSIQYTDGTGIFNVISDSNTISWLDDKGDAGNGLVFSSAF